MTALLWLAAALPLQEQQYRERQVLDPTKDEWVDQAAAAPGSPVGDLEQARSLLARGQSNKARDVLKPWVTNNRADDRYLEGVFLLGEAYFELKDFYKAYEQYQVVADNASGDLFRDALRREVDVARAFLAGEKRIFWGILRLPAYEDGVSILDRVWERVPGTRLGEEALKLKADYFFRRGDMDLAQDEYANLSKQFPSGRYVRFAMLRAAEAANAAYRGTPYDDRPLVEAEERYRGVKTSFPQYADQEKVDDRLTAIRTRRADKDLAVARWYQKTGQRGAAEYYYRLILQDWPDTLAAAEARTGLRAMGIDVESERAER